MGGGCEPWCCEHHPCRAPACPNAFTDSELPPLPPPIMTPVALETQTAPPSTIAATAPPEVLQPVAPLVMSAEEPPACPLPTPPTAVEPQDIQIDDVDGESSPPTLSCVPPAAPVAVQPQEEPVPLPPVASELPNRSVPAPVQPQDIQMDDDDGPPPPPPPPPPAAAAAPPPHIGSGSGSGAAPGDGEGGNYPPPGHRPYPSAQGDSPPRRGRADTGEYYDPYDYDYRPPPRDRYREYSCAGARPTDYDSPSLWRPRRRHRYDHNDDDRGRYYSPRDYCPIVPPPPPRSLGVRDYCVPMRRRWCSSSRETEREREPSPSGPRSNDCEDDDGPGTLVRDNVVIGDPTGVRIGEGNRGGRRTAGRVTGNVVIR